MIFFILMGLNLGQTDNNVCMRFDYNWRELSQSLIDEYYAIHNGVCKKYEERLVVIYDFNIKELKTNLYNSIIQLEPIVDGINLFVDIDQCIEFLIKNEHAKIFLIIHGPISDSIMSRIHHLSQVNSIYILLQHESYDDQSIKNWSKVTGIYTETSVIYNALKQTIQDSIGIVPKSGEKNSEEKIRKKKSGKFLKKDSTVYLTKNHVQERREII
ncbi:unnamed protein product [Adineta steineri]|uniref:Uncharacterized protein n=1 Tax=Adineta steineri TaxID=433720 RepID=A0A819UZL7_9BILA|nr:unnamed protein product [Adineta steineri]